MKDADALITISAVLLLLFVFVKALIGNGPNKQSISSEKYMPTVEKAGNGNVAIFDPKGNVKDSNYTFSDSISPNSLWSSDKITNFFNSSFKTPINDALTSTGTTWSSSNIVNQLKSQMDDSKVSPNSTWSSSAILTNLTAVADALKPSGGVSGNFPNYSASGNLQDSGYFIDDNSNQSLWTAKGVVDNMIKDSEINRGATWSSQKMANTFIEKNVNQTEGSVLLGGTQGNISESRFFIDDTRGPAANILWTSDKIGEIKDNQVGSNITWSSQQILNTIQSTASVLNQNSLISGASGNIPNISPTGVLVDSGVSLKELSDKQPKDILAKDGRLATFSSGSTVDSGFLINDSAAPSPNILWSSSRFLGLPNSLASYDSQGVLSAADLGILPGNLVVGSGSSVSDSGISIKDTSVGTNVLWTSEKIAQELQNVKPSVPEGNLVVGSGSSVSDSGISIKDTSVGTNVLWTSEKIAQELQKTKPNFTNSPNQILVSDASGQISPSGKSINDGLGPDSNVMWSSEKTAGFLKSLLPATSNRNTILTTSSEGIADSGFIIDDGSVSTNSLWSSSKSISSFLPKVAANEGKILTATSAGDAQTSIYSIDDKAPQNQSILWTSKKMFETFIPNKGNPNAILSFDQNGNLVQSSVLDDSKNGSNVLWSSSKIQSQLDAINSFASKYSVNDATSSSSTLWTSEKISSALSLKVAFDAISYSNFNSLNTPVTYESINLNIGGGLQSTGIFIAPLSGVYFFHWQAVQNDDQGLDVRAFFKKNNVTAMGTYSYQTKHAQLVMSMVQNLNAVDSVWVEINQGSIMSTPSDKFTKFSGYLIG